MELSLAQYISEDITSKSVLITTFSNDMKFFFAGKDYGPGLKEINIGIICVRPEFAQFFQPGKPKYTKEKEVRKRDITIEVEKTLEYRIVIDYDSFKKANNEEANKLLAKGIVSSLGKIDKVDIEEFDKTQFKIDLAQYFRTKDLLNDEEDS
ncbi:MAG: hypothetical protein KIT80_13195 [Chitinophagaceae bacterium]|nr:hypothetical protein [Chitinophagaceae bacterium]MCW5927863.1 hypothetical protein [Chitinophagaceae bacterium]